MNYSKFRSYHPREKGDGCVAEFNYSVKNNCIYLMMAPQVGTENKFDYDKKLTAMLGLTDLGELLTVVCGRKGGAGSKDGDKYKGLYHSNKTGSAIIQFYKSDYGYNLGLSVDKNGVKSRCSMILTPAEGELLRVFIENNIGQMFLDNQEQPSQEKASTNTF